MILNKIKLKNIYNRCFCYSDLYTSVVKGSLGPDRKTKLQQVFHLSKVDKSTYISTQNSETTE